MWAIYIPPILAVVALINCICSKQPTKSKIIWSLFILLVPLIGALLWFLLGKPKS